MPNISRRVVLASPLCLILLLLPFLFPAAVKSDDTVPALQFSDLMQRQYVLRSKGAKPAVFVFLSTECPISNRYLPRVLSLAKVYEGRGFRFFAVYPNGTESQEDVQQHAKERGITFPVVRDTGTLTRVLGATMTPEAVIVDPSGAIRYRGRIDDNADPSRITSRDLAKALDALKGGKAIPVARTKAFGCAIPARTTTHTPPTATGVTYTRDIAPILNKRCVACHRAGEVGPFPLDSYERAVRWSKAIQEQTATRKMPPWKANSRGEFHDDMRLSEEEITKIAQWTSGGTPQGNLKDLPPLPTFPKGWRLGEPDAIIEMPEEYTVPADSKDVYRCFVIPADFGEDRWIKGIEFQPGNRAVVHHMTVFLDTTGQARRMADANKSDPGYINPTPGNGPGFSPVAGQAGGWVPGHFPRFLPQGVGIEVPKGADIVLEVHYHPTGKDEKDRSRFAFYFSKEPIKQRLRVGGANNETFRIPAGDSNYTIEFSEFVPEDITLFSVSPHMHYLGKSMKATVTFPDGTKHPLIDVPDWDFRWQPSYRFKERMRLPRGSRIDVVARFDNSAQNPNNPNRPPKIVTWGEGSNDEMCVCFVAYTRDDEDLTKEPVLVP